MKRALTALLFLSLSLSLNAQYTYVEANFGYHNLRFKRVDDGELENIALNELRMNVSGIYRLSRRFGLGFSIGLPIISDFNSNYSTAPTTIDNSLAFSGSDLREFGSYAPTEFLHDLQNPYTISIYPRLYLDDESTVYFDLRFNLLRMSEQFTFIRPELNPSGTPTLEERNIRYDESFTVTGFGLKVGAENKFAEHWVLSYGLILDFYNFDQHDAFEYDIEYQQSNANSGYDYDRVFLGSAAQGQDISWQFGYGISYVF